MPIPISSGDAGRVGDGCGVRVGVGVGEDVGVAVQMMAVGRGPGGIAGGFVKSHIPVPMIKTMLANNKARHPH